MAKQSDNRFRRNFPLMVADGSFFQTGLAFISTSTVLPLFIKTMTGSTQSVGIVLALASFCTYFFRLFVGPVVPQITNRVRFNTYVNFLCRPLIIIPGLLLVFGKTDGATLMVCLSYLLIWIGDAIIMPPWMEYMAATVEESRQGKLLGLQQLIGGIAGIVASVIIGYLLGDKSISSTGAFGMVFTLAGVMMLLSCVAVAFTKDVARDKVRFQLNYRQYFGGIPAVFRREKDFQRLMLTHIIQFVASMSVPFIIICAQETVKIPAHMVSWLIVAQSMGVPAGGWIWGFVSEHYGPDKVSKLIPLCVLAVPVLALLAMFIGGGAAIVFFLPAMFIAGIASGAWVGLYAYISGAVPESSRPTCMVLMGLMILPFTFAQYLASAIADCLGYAPLFALCAALAIAAIISSSRIRSIREIQSKSVENNEITAGG